MIMKVLEGKRETQVVATSDHINSWLTRILPTISFTNSSIEEYTVCVLIFKG